MIAASTARAACDRSGRPGASGSNLSTPIANDLKRHRCKSRFAVAANPKAAVFAHRPLTASRLLCSGVLSHDSFFEIGIEDKITPWSPNLHQLDIRYSRSRPKLKAIKAFANLTKLFILPAGYSRRSSATGPPTSTFVADQSVDREWS
jgi:hypothetical protein